MSVVARTSRVVAGVLLTVAATLVAPARAADGDAGERARLAEQRSAAEAGFAARDEECRQRFVVSACVADARRDRRTALDVLRARERVLDDARRQERAGERRAALTAKAADDSKRERERAAMAASSPAAAASTASAASRPREGRPFEGRHEPKLKKPASSKANPATRQQLEERNRASFEARQQEAAQHREETVEATIKRMEKRSPARSLPIPSASAVRAASAP